MAPSCDVPSGWLEAPTCKNNKSATPKTTARTTAVNLTGTNKFPPNQIFSLPHMIPNSTKKPKSFWTQSPEIRLVPYHLDKLTTGDAIKLRDRSGRAYEYRVTESLEVAPGASCR